MAWQNLFSNGPIIFSNVQQVIDESITRIKQDNYDSMHMERDMALDYYQYNNTSRYIAKYFEGSIQSEMPLYTNNMTKRLINRISLVYKDAPIREIESDDYESLIKMKDVQFKTFERIHNLLGTIAVQVIWNDEYQCFNYRPVLKFEPVFDKDDPLHPIGIVYVASRTTGSTWQNQADEFIYWSDEDHFRFDSDGIIKNVNEENENPYGVMPFCFLQPNTIVDEFWNDGGIDIAFANRQIDVSMTMLQHHIRSAGGQFVIEGQVDSRNLRLGLNRVIQLENAEMDNISPNVNINDIIEGVKFQLQNVAQNHHVSFDFGLSGSQSGVALKMENLELLESREDEVEKFRYVEDKIYNIERAILEAETGRTLPEEIRLDYAEVEFPDEENERQRWEWKFKHGIADKVDYLMETNPDRFTSREEAQAYLDERSSTQSNKETNGLLNALKSPTPMDNNE